MLKSAGGPLTLLKHLQAPHLDQTGGQTYTRGDGQVAEWLRSGLQSRVHEFDSRPGLHRPHAIQLITALIASFGATAWSCCSWFFLQWQSQRGEVGRVHASRALGLR